MESTVEQLIEERSYSSLNDKEKAMVSELCADEQEFNQMKQFFAAVSGTAVISQFEPSADLKSSLDSVFAAKHGGIGARLTPREVASAPVAAAKIIPFYQQTWARAAAGVLLIAGVVSIWQLSGNSTLTNEQKPQMAQAETKQEEKLSATMPYIEPTVVPEKASKVKVASPLAKTNPAIISEDKSAESDAVAEYSDVMAASSKSIPALQLSEAETDKKFSSAFGKVKTGRDADLYPDGRKDSNGITSANASAVSASQEDLLSYIVPAF